MTRPLSGFFIAVLLLLSVAAYSDGDPDTAAANGRIELKKGHPQVYLVQRGDTLWEIANRFLNAPWRWKEIWYANPAIKNPDLIYPGDRIALVLVDGKTRLQVTRRGKVVVKLSPKVREVTSREVIGLFAADKLLEFTALPRIMSEAEFKRGAYVLKTAGERLVAGVYDKVYVRGLKPQQGRDHGVYRLGQNYLDPLTKKSLGREILNIGKGYIQRWGDPATMLLTKANQEVMKGMRVFPSEAQDSFIHFAPTTPDLKIKGEVIGFLDGLTTGAQDSIIAINLGREQGAKRGQVYGVFEGGELLVDEERSGGDGFFSKNVESDWDSPFGETLSTAQAAKVVEDPMAELPSEVIIPERRFGIVMLFRVYQNISYGVIMNSTQAVRVGDLLHAP